jgi:hypothetical protein
MKKQLKDLNISIPVIDVLESRKLFGGNGGYGDPPLDGGTIDEVVVRPDSPSGGGQDPYPDDDHYSPDDPVNDSDLDHELEQQYSDAWDKLNDAEKAFVRSHPEVAKEFLENAQKALQEAKDRYPDSLHNGVGDAFRHAYWASLNTVDAGQALARQYGDAHEQSPGQPENEKDMDLYNNSVGYYIGNEALKEGWDENRIIDEIEKAIRDDKLQTYVI